MSYLKILGGDLCYGALSSIDIHADDEQINRHSSAPFDDICGSVSKYNGTLSQITQITLTYDPNDPQNIPDDGNSGDTGSEIFSSIRYVGERAFMNCDGIEHLYFNVPKDTDVLHLGDYAFSFCDNLGEITLNSHFEMIGELCDEGTLTYNSANANIIVP